MASVLHTPNVPIVDTNGNLSTGALVYVYDAGTTDLAGIYTDSALSSAAANPYTASNGLFPLLFVSGGQSYKIECQTSAGGSLPGWPIDDIPTPAADGGGTVPITSGGTGATTAGAARTALGAADAATVATLSSTVSGIATEQDDADWQAGTGTSASVITPAQNKLAIEALEATQSGVPDAVIYDEKTSGSAGGTFTSGAWQTRTLNTEYDPNSVVALSSNQITPTKDGVMIWSAPAYAVDEHQTRLYNVTDAAAVRLGTSEFARAASFQMTRSLGWAIVEKNKAYRLEHRCGATGTTSGFGRAASFDDEVYAVVQFFSAHQE